MMRYLKGRSALVGLLFCFVSFFSMGQAAAEAIRLKDLGRFSGWRENALVGYGLVTGLAGTGDSLTNKATRQSISNMLSQFGLTLTPDQIASRNVAAVMVNANLSPFARVGDGLDITVTSIGDARSLVGGALMVTPLKGPDGKIYALAQGALSVGGYKYDAAGNVVQKNHPTVGSVPNGATVEVSLRSENLNRDGNLTFLLTSADYTTVSRVANAINANLCRGCAKAEDAASVEINIPNDQKHKLIDFMTRIENLQVEPDRRARVVVNERTGTIVAGGDVKIDKVAISQGDLRVTISTENTASQPILVSQTGEGVRTAIVSNTRVDVSELNESGFVAANNNTVADLVQSLTKIKTSTRDIISVLRAIKAAGALHAELIIQ